MNVNEKISQLIDLAIQEDIGDGDHTSISTIPVDAVGTATLYSKDVGILAGVQIARKVLEKIDKDIESYIFLSDGSSLEKGDKIFTLRGKSRSILMAERLMLNFMQRMSGIATQTHQYAKLIADLPTKVLDTRKTTPNMRIFEKMAVEIGGGVNHRMGLYDMIMIKDNHVDFAGGIENAILKAYNYIKKNKLDIQIEIEVRNFQELNEVIRVGKIQRIMLDNFSVGNTKSAVRIVAGRYEIESSGNINLQTIRDYALCGVDYVSVGALTHQISSLDLSLLAEK